MQLKIKVDFLENKIEDLIKRLNTLEVLYYSSLEQVSVANHYGIMDWIDSDDSDISMETELRTSFDSLEINEQDDLIIETIKQIT